ncbi:MAG: flavodoxin domain-containing protein [Rikenellaceae bacterium]|nr:flavodoxin domain-containing protein [Rikenellaceae bacterium]MCL2692302.1 flavodoxin domain-containing protein [Rikenellaceae bacterium]
MKTAIIYASKYGTTEKVAEQIARRLAEKGDIELISLRNNPRPDIAPFDAVVLGTSIYTGRPAKKMKVFCTANESALLHKRLGLVVCGMHPDEAERAKELRDAYPAALHEAAVAEGFMGGEFLFDRMNFLERLVARKIAKTKSSVHSIDSDAVERFAEKFLK